MPLVTANPKRDWMDKTPNQFAYRCLPLVMANQLGWDILSPVRFTAMWNGRINPEDVLVNGPEEIKSFVKPHFGSGVLTFTLNCTFRTDPETELLVTGPFNSIKPGIMPLTGLVESWWLPFTFTMNWKFTHSGQLVVFEAGESLCRILPISRTLTEEIRPEIRPYTEQADRGEEYLAWSKSRAEFNEGLHSRDPETVSRGWQKYYMQGKRFDGSHVENHRTKLKQAEFIKLQSLIIPNSKIEPDFSKPKQSVEIIGTHSKPWNLKITPIKLNPQTSTEIVE